MEIKAWLSTRETKESDSDKIEENRKASRPAVLHKMDAQNDISTWISSIPLITKWWFFSYFLVPLTTRLGLISPMNLLLFSEAVIYKFEVKY